MIHRFYSLPPKQQFIFQLKLALGFIVFNLAMGAVLFSVGLPVLSILVIALSLSVFAPFIDVPSGVKAGSLIYYSPLLIGEKIRKKRLVLHSGSLFDYYFVLNKTDSAQQKRKQVFTAYVEGLLTLIEHFEQQPQNGITVKASSYIINSRTASKLGLKAVNHDFIQRLILYFNAINLTCALSLLNNRLTWPNLLKVQTFEGTLDDLIAKKAHLIKLQKRLSAKPKPSL